MNLHLAALARQPTRQPWPMHRLLEERAVALGFALEDSTASTYTSHLNSYLTFCNIHHLPIEPTADTLSFYIVFMCCHIKPSSVESYLSGICNQLEPWFPRVQEIRTSGHKLSPDARRCVELQSPGNAHFPRRTSLISCMSTHNLLHMTMLCFFASFLQRGTVSCSLVKSLRMITPLIILHANL